MKKNFMKLAYVTVAVASMITFSHKDAYAQQHVEQSVDQCHQDCGTAEGDCLQGGGGACQGDYVDCEVGCG